ncbi:GyrI-like domain-containing protein [Erysipelotrichaceae bacterium OttesenSCG-928-M19]|nr:GyrI-like domain-containing protein [Erysipelotrichaceae bacterium OttesenSCG-928-M19]
MTKIDYKKDYKDIYLPKQKPSIIKLEPMKYVTIEYLGDPSDSKYQSVMSALYGFAYTIKMKSKKRDDYYEYVVFPLEGIWDLQDYSLDKLEKSNFKATMMIRQPDFVDEKLFEEYREVLLSKEQDQAVIKRIESAKLEIIDEDLCVQILHIGSYDDEPASFALMEQFCQENGYRRLSKVHKEIYLSDPRKVSKDKLKTVLRFKVEKL